MSQVKQQKGLEHGRGEPIKRNVTREKLDDLAVVPRVLKTTGRAISIRAVSGT